MLQGNVVKIFNSTQTFKNVFCLKFELILIIGPNNVLTEGARKVYRGRRVGQGCWVYRCVLMWLSNLPIVMSASHIVKIGNFFKKSNVDIHACTFRQPCASHLRYALLVPMS
jgi:hypothetical protein